MRRRTSTAISLCVFTCSSAARNCARRSAPPPSTSIMRPTSAATSTVNPRCASLNGSLFSRPPISRKPASFELRQNATPASAPMASSRFCSDCIS